MVVDAAFAKTAGAGPPVLMSGDGPVYGRFAQRYLPAADMAKVEQARRVFNGNKEPLNDAIARELAGGFTIDIPDGVGGSRKLRVIPVGL